VHFEVKFASHVFSQQCADCIANTSNWCYSFVTAHAHLLHMSSVSWGKRVWLGKHVWRPDCMKSYSSSSSMFALGIQPESG